MCGILGYYNFIEKDFNSNHFTFQKLMKESFSRGKEASGLAILSNENTIYLLKSDLDGKKLPKTNEYKKLFDSVENQNVVATIGHSRIATHGTQLLQTNNQPVISSDRTKILVHNGIVTNSNELWKIMQKSDLPPELDTKTLIEYLCFLLQTHSNKSTLINLYKDIEGAASIAVIDSNSKNLILATNTGSLYYVIDDKNESLYFASEKIFLNAILDQINTQQDKVLQLKPQTALIASHDSIDVIEFKTYVEPNYDRLNVDSEINSTPTYIDFSAPEFKSEATKLYTVKNNLEKLKTHDFDYEKIYNIQRCTKCILPATTPFIKFDDKGVCNYCNDHKTIKYKGIDELEKIVSKYRKSNGEPDCLAAFSGGKDSSYGLHFLKKELGLQPLAYTYDWGMVTDIARKNQARILGKLGIEHLVVSADITKKRNHIRKNILAWMKDPHPGMVTLFMEGDKQCEFYADQLKKKYKIDLMFFFRGNELEIDEFKTGHCGVKDADPGGVIHNLEYWKKIKLLSFYASKYFKNPAYFNSSFFDTSLAFFTTYIQKHDYVFLWHYIPWVESEILSTLDKEYNFELPTETLQTWRTDDGTSAFYNYIYYHVQGFTENDSFRSRQIREGLMDRETALNLVNRENKPRHNALQWYFDVVGLDGDEVLSVVDKMKKLY